MTQIQIQNKLKYELNRDLIDYFGSLKYQIDTRAQEVFEDFDREKVLRTVNGIERRRNDFIKINEKMLEIVDQILESNQTKIIEKNFANLTMVDIADEEKASQMRSNFKEHVRKNLLIGYCYFIRKDKLKEEYKEIIPNFIGVLFVSDWYLNENQLNFMSLALKDLNKNEMEKLIWTLNADVLNLFYGLQKLKLKKSRNNYGIIKLSKQIIITELIYLERLELVGSTAIKFIKPNTFQIMKSLKFLSLRGNQLEEINKTTFKGGLKNLEELDLGFNNIQTIHDNSFKWLGNLKKLNLHSNNLEQINELHFFNLNNLEELNLNHNNIKNIQSNAFKSLAKVKKLYLSDNKINELNDAKLIGLTNLRELYLSYNKFEIISENSFRCIKKLKKLDLIGINFDKLSHYMFLGLYESLEELKLSFHGETIEINIEQNLLQRLYKLKSLRLLADSFLNFNGNLFYGLTNLQELIIYLEKTLKIEPESFKFLINLKKLSISLHTLPKIRNNLLNGLTNLRELTINGRNITEIEQFSFLILKKLKFLALRVNAELYNDLKFLNSSASCNDLKNYYGLSIHQELEIEIHGY